jgi:Ras-related protein Rab-1A
MNYFLQNPNKNDNILNIPIDDNKTSSHTINTFIKCLLIGSSGVGKSSIMERYTTDNFYNHFITTIGVDYRFKNIYIDNYNIKIQLWDTASQERFRCITTNYYRNSHIIIICYDITDIHSFNDLEYWINDCQKNILEPVIIALCGTKNDLDKKRIISFKDAKNYAEFKNFPYFEISSKDGNGINYMFESLIKSKLNDSNFIKITVEPEIINDNNIIYINNSYDYSFYNNQPSCCWQFS